MSIPFGTTHARRLCLLSSTRPAVGGITGVGGFRDPAVVATGPG